MDASANNELYREENVTRELLEKKVIELAKKLEETTKTKEVISKLLDEMYVQNSRLQTILSSIGEGLYVVNTDFIITLSNTAASKILNIPLRDVMGSDARNLINVSKDNREVLEENPIVQAMQFKKVVSVDLDDDMFYQSTKGKKFPVALTASPIYGSRGIAGVVVVFKDISDEKALDDAKSNFISITSHQLRTPLTSMRWFSEMLIEGDAGHITTEQKHFVKRIYDGVERMINLVNLLLQIARVEAGRLKIEPVPTDFKKLIQDIKVSLKSQLDAKSHRIKIMFDPNPFPQIPMDQDVIWQVIQNLISNANRYTPKQKTITISLKKKDLMAQFSVEDKGIGIPKAEHDKIFEKFYRAENALKLVPEGSGLGLSLVKSLVEGWGGKVWFESKEGAGTTFYFTIPLKGMVPTEGEVKLTI